MKIGNFFLKFLVFLLITEIGLRVVNPEALEYYRVQKQIHVFNNDYLVDLEPNVNVRIKHIQNRFNIKFQTNSRGFRSEETNNSLPQIGCIGDSVTMGFGVSNGETFCSLLDGYKDKTGVTYQSVNLGVDAYGPSAIERKLEKNLNNLNLKLLFYFPSNGDDIDEANFYSKMQDRSKFLIFKYQFLATKYSYLALATKITQEQMVYRFRETFIDTFISSFQTFKCTTNVDSDSNCKYKNFSDYLYSFVGDFYKREKLPDNLPPVFPENECQEKNDPHIIPDSVKESTRKIVNLAKKHNIKLVFLLSPIDIETAYCSQRGKMHRLYNYSMNLKEFLIHENLEYIDLNQYTRQMKDSNGLLNPRPYYIIGDGHYTALGNQWVYSILKQITEEKLP